MYSALSGSRIESIGVYVPDRKVTSIDLMSSLKHKVGIDLERLTGIHERRVCDDTEDSYSLAISAAKDCLNYSSYHAEDLDMIINCSISRSKDDRSQIFEPPLSVYVKEELGAVNALNFDISNACAGMLTGVYLLNKYISAGAVRNGMVVSGEYITHISDSAARSVRTIASKQLASLTVGDAGAAVILERSEDAKSLAVSEFTTLSKYSDLCIGQPCLNQPGGYMKANARKIHRVALAESPELLRRALERSGIELDQIDHIIPHQTSKRSIKHGIRSMTDYFGRSPKNVIINLKEFGNTASTTVFLALYRYLKEGFIKKGEQIMLICYASGLVVGVIIFEVDRLADSYGKQD